MPSQPPKGRLVSHFENRDITNHGQGWSSLWDTGDSDLWDRGKPSPALIDLIEAHPKDLLNPFSSTKDGGERRKKALVPGCGRGYDVIALALHGFDAYGLEISATAVSEANAYAEVEMRLQPPREFNFGPANTTTTTTTGNGSVKFLEGDFFSSEWTGDVKFDLVYDYTFLCALHPGQRKDWAKRMAELVRPGGVLVCLEFPMYKDPSLPGPPWGVNGVHIELLGRKFTRVLYEQPERTFEVGKGTDMISVYQRR